MTFLLKALGTVFLIGGCLLAQYDPEKRGNLLPRYFLGEHLEQLVGGLILLALGIGFWAWSVSREHNGK